jgi:hypothetical protein
MAACLAVFATSSTNNSRVLEAEFTPWAFLFTVLTSDSKSFSWFL